MYYIDIKRETGGQENEEIQFKQDHEKGVGAGKKWNDHFSRIEKSMGGSKGDEGDLIVSSPVTGQIYGWGQKDYRGGNTEKNFVKWDGSQFIECDKFGYEK